MIAVISPRRDQQARQRDYLDRNPVCEQCLNERGKAVKSEYVRVDPIPGTTRNKFTALCFSCFAGKKVQAVLNRIAWTIAGIGAAVIALILIF